MKLFKICLPLFLFLVNLLYAGLPITSSLDVQESWFTSESENFRFIFPAHLREVAGVIEKDAEDVFKELKTWTNYTPKYKLDVIITDNSDLASASVQLSSNGYYLTINAVHPYQDFMDGIDAYKSWYRNLLIHELTHIIHQDMVEGFPAFTHKIFGKLIYPNTSNPLFYTEGFPTYTETVKENGYGRGNYTYTNMLVRTAILEENPPLLDRASNSTWLWPGGQTRYLYGVSFVNWLVRNYGEQKLITFNKNNSSKLSFTSSLAFKKVYGKTFQEVWDKWLEEETRKAHDFQKGLEFRGITKYIPVGTKRGYVYSFAMSNSGKTAAYSIRPADKLGGLYLYDFKTEKERCIKKGLYAESILFSNDDRKLWYIRGDLRKNVYYENNIYEFDIAKKTEKKITENGHIQGFMFTDSENELLICYSTPYGTDIRFLTINGETKSTIRQTILPVVEQPVLSGDKTNVAFSCRNREGNRAIYITALDDLKNETFIPKRITSLNQNAYSPEWLSSEELVFVGDNNSVYNLFRVNIQNENIARITNVPTGIFDPDISADGTVLLQEYTSSGYRIVKTSMNELRYNYPVTEPEIAETPSEDVSTTSVRQSNNDYAIAEYNAAQWLFPGYWSPLFIDQRISLGVGFYTSGSDLLQRHAYNMGLLFDVIDAQFKSFINYTHYSYPFNYFVSLFATQRTDTATFSPSVAIFPGISFPLIERDFLLKADLGMIFESPYAGPDLSFYYSSTRRPLHWIGPEQGIVFEQGLYYNMGQEQFLILSDYFSWYQRLLEILLLNIRIQSRWNPVDDINRVTYGAYSKFVYVPLNSVYTLGFPDIVPARFAMDVKTTLKTRLFSVDRGIGSLPLFFEGVNLSAFLDNGLAASPNSLYDVVVGDINELVEDPWGHIRSSAGAELEVEFLIGYQYPLIFDIGYVYPISSGGKSGIYVDARLELPF
ncbi:MAG: hypothetical protein JSV25_05935 [Spirochaetota bacterium]|nr:MAG: hypothetical protein JSV25_05935 [Spirochaetota bacterium]